MAKITYFHTDVMPEKPPTGRPPKYAWATLGIGDGFHVKRPPLTFRMIVRAAQRRYGIRLTCTYQPDGSARVTRVP